jgi:hypothetical protein
MKDGRKWWSFSSVSREGKYERNRMTVEVDSSHATSDAQKDKERVWSVQDGGRWAKMPNKLTASECASIAVRVRIVVVNNNDKVEWLNQVDCPLQKMRFNWLTSNQVRFEANESIGEPRPIVNEEPNNEPAKSGPTVKSFRIPVDLHLCGYESCEDRANNRCRRMNNSRNGHLRSCR